MKNIFIVLLSLFSITAFSQVIIGGGGKCYTNDNPNTVPSIMDGAVINNNCVEVYDTVANIHYTLDKSLSLGNRWVKVTNSIDSVQLTDGLGNLPRWQLALQKLKSGTNYMSNLILIGDSETNNPLIYITQTKANFQKQHNRTMPSGFIGFQTVNPPVDGIQLAKFGTWVTYDQDNGLDGGAASTVTLNDSVRYRKVYSLVEARAGDRTIVFYEKQPGGGAFTWYAGGENQTRQTGTVNTSGSGLGILVIDNIDTTGNYGMIDVTLQLTTTGSTGMKILGFATTSANNMNGVTIHKIGRGGWSATTYWKDMAAKQIWKDQLAALNPDITFVALGSNDTNQDIATVNSSTNSLMTNIESAFPLGSKILMTSSDISIAGTGIGSKIPQIAESHYSLAKNRNWGYLSIYKLLGSSTQQYADGTTADGVHDSQLGGQINGDFIYTQLTGITPTTFTIAGTNSPKQGIGMSVISNTVSLGALDADATLLPFTARRNIDLGSYTLALKNGSLSINTQSSLGHLTVSGNPGTSAAQFTGNTPAAELVGINQNGTGIGLTINGTTGKTLNLVSQGGTPIYVTNYNASLYFYRRMESGSTSTQKEWGTFDIRANGVTPVTGWGGYQSFIGTDLTGSHSVDMGRFGVKYNGNTTNTTDMFFAASGSGGGKLVTNPQLTLEGTATIRKIRFNDYTSATYNPVTAVGMLVIDANGYVGTQDLPLSTSTTAITPFNSAIAAGADAQVSITLTGIAVGDVVAYTLGSTDLPTGVIVKSVRVSAANTAVVTLTNTTAASLTPNVTIYTKKL